MLKIENVNEVFRNENKMLEESRKAKIACKTLSDVKKILKEEVRVHEKFLEIEDLDEYIEKKSVKRIPILEYSKYKVRMGIVRVREMSQGDIPI